MSYSLLSTTTRSTTTRRFSQPLFGGSLDVEIYEPVVGLNVIMRAFVTEALRLQKIFNIYDPESEISILNRERSAYVSHELFTVLETALRWSRETQGRFDVTLGRAFLARKEGKPPPKISCSYKDVKIHVNISDATVSLLHDDVLLDLGSIAKGFIADRLAEFLKEHGVTEFLIDARGDIVFSGAREHIIGVQDPRRDESACWIRVKDCAVATSGDYLQYFDDFTKSHILQGETDGRVIAATAVSPTLMEADILATVLMVIEAESIEALLPPQACACLFDEAGKASLYDFESLLVEEPL